MKPPKSTGALTKPQHEAQDAIYAEKHEYDYLIIGTGLAALTSGALLAKAGYKICMLEAHDIPGGYAHTFSMGKFSFCAQIHYIWGCAPGDTVYEFLKKIGLEKEIEFELFDPEGYDHMVLPDGKRVKIPYGWEKLANNIEAAYPGQREYVLKFTGILSRIQRDVREYPSERGLRWWEYVTKGYKFLFLLKYLHKTVQDVFDECGLSKEAQAVLIGQCGDFMSPPRELSIFAFSGLFSGYNTGAYYPKKHYKFYVERVAKYIADQPGCHIFYETPVSKLNIAGGKVESVETKNGKIFRAKNFICNADPQMTSEKLIGWDKFPGKFQKPLRYEYAPAGMMVYLGLKDINLTKYGFGRHNTWHLTQWDMNKMWQEQLAHNFANPWVFISTPTLHSKEPGIAPEGCEIMEIATVTSYDMWKTFKEKGEAVYKLRKEELANRLIDFVEANYIPDLKKHIVQKVVGTNTTNEHYVLAPEGNAYGSAMTPEQTGLGRLKAKTPWPNFFWCNASSGYAGFCGTTGTGMGLYMQLTNDYFHTAENTPTDEELVARVQK